MLKTALFASLLSSVALAGAHAQTVAALTGDSTIVLIDAPRGRRTRRGRFPASPKGRGHRRASLRWPALCSHRRWLGGDGGHRTPARRRRSPKLESMLPAGVMATVDFNPVADRLRVIGSDGTNLRVNVDDGRSSVRQPELRGHRCHEGGEANVIAGALPMR